MATIMIYATRALGYRHDGVQYGPAPTAIAIVKAKGVETADDALARRRSGKLTEADMASIDKLMSRATAAGIEPALRTITHVTEEAAADRELADKRASMEGLNAQLSDGRIRLGALGDELSALRDAKAESDRQLSAMTDRIQAAARELAATETTIGTLKELKGENKKLAAENKRLAAEVAKLTP